MPVILFEREAKELLQISASELKEIGDNVRSVFLFTRFKHFLIYHITPFIYSIWSG